MRWDDNAPEFDKFDTKCTEYIDRKAGMARLQGKQALNHFLRIGFARKHSPLQINLMFIVLFKPILECPL
jgi:hypothetical protein